MYEMYEIYCKPKQHWAIKSPAVTGGEWTPMYKQVADACKWTVRVLASRRAFVFEKDFETEEEARRMAELLRQTAFPCGEVYTPENTAQPSKIAL